MKKVRFNSVDFSRLRRPLFKSESGARNSHRGWLRHLSNKKLNKSHNRTTRIIFASSASTYKVTRLKELKFKFVLARE